MDSSDDLLVPLEPTLLTVEEASRVLRIGRQLAYQLAHEYMASGGITGIPVIRFGVKNLRVPRWALVELAGRDRQRREGLPQSDTDRRAMGTETVRTVIVCSGAGELRHRLGPTAWVVLEELLQRSNDGEARVSIRTLAVSLG